jgi:putative dimethyl sulfoxide reductase chaperone
MQLMTKEEKEHLCQLMAILFSPPDEEMVEQIHQGGGHSFRRRFVESCDGDLNLLNGFLMEGDPGIILKNLGDEYDRLFSRLNNGSISPVESVYKPWTQDPSCSLPFASERGLLMSDSAMHLLEIYRQTGLDMAEEFKGCPDHIALELEFLSYLYGGATDKEVKQFVEDHLDWIPPFRDELMKLHPHPFYGSLLEILDLFLTKERKRLEMMSNG